ncbi:carboxymuconolactone decarboxylase family protein [Hymenobacter sp.]|uniref:carboxymuconolactone decarboxylase family protein n=1 Tax=Hymenobacter sp. TaxID=1898978 RepID=UPI00286A5A86|nr:carboxymuconolactone decarboxylase family protein [Hymenobacter sp.]
MPRLTAIDRPSSLLLRALNWYSRRKFGKVLAPFRYIYPRSTPVMSVSLKMLSAERKLKLPAVTRVLIRYYVSHLNHCAFCSNAQEYAAQEENLELAKLRDLFNFRQSLRFSAAEKALLAYLEEVTLTKTASDDVFAELQRHYSERDIVEITWLNASENYFNLLAKPLGLTSDELTLNQPNIFA